MPANHVGAIRQVDRVDGRSDAPGHGKHVPAEPVEVVVEEQALCSRVIQRRASIAVGGRVISSALRGRQRIEASPEDRDDACTRGRELEHQ